MKHIICILVLLSASIIPHRFSLAQAPKGKTTANHFGVVHTWGAYGGFYYAIPQKKFLRADYDNAFPIINTDFPPIGLELGLLYRLTPSVDLMLDIGTRKHILIDGLLCRFMLKVLLDRLQKNLYRSNV